MSKKTKWHIVATNDPTGWKMLSEEERKEVRENKRKNEFRDFHFGEMIKRMETEKPKFNKVKRTKHQEEETEEE